MHGQREARQAKGKAVIRKLIMLFPESSVADDGGYKLIIRQEPAHARVAIGKDKGEVDSSCPGKILRY